MTRNYVAFRVLLAALLMLAAVPAEAADVKELFAIDLADYPGKEGRMIEVSYPPGARDMVHRHDAHAFVYVLEGQIVMQLKGQPAVTLKAGQTFYEGPTDVHVVGRNASNTEPARFVVVLLKAKGAPVLTPVKDPNDARHRRPTRHRSAARVSRGWLVRGVRHERDGCQLDGIHYHKIAKSATSRTMSTAGASACGLDPSGWGDGGRGQYGR